MWLRDLVTGAFVASTLLTGSWAVAVPENALSSTKWIPRQEPPADAPPESSLDQVQLPEESDPAPTEEEEESNEDPPPPEESGDSGDPPPPEESGDSGDPPPPEESDDSDEDAAAPSIEVSQISCKDVDINDFRDKSSAKEVWDKSGAGKLGDDYIAEHGIKTWVQDLDQAIFQQGPSQSWDCRDYGPECNLGRADCDDYEKTDYGNGAYYLFYSLQTFHGFLKEFKERIQDNAIAEGLDIDKIHDDFEDKSVGGSNPLVVAAGAFSVVGGFGAGNPVFGGITSVISGALVAIGNSGKTQDKGSNGEGPMADRVKKVFTDLREFVDNVNRAAFGIEGYDPEKLIPDEMQKGNYSSAAIRLLGDGQWLMGDVTDGLSEAMDNMYQRMRQGLAWSMMRWGRNAFVFIDDPVTYDECGTRFNAGKWDDEKKWCFRLFAAEGDKIYPIEDELADKLWSTPYNIDKLVAYRNAYDCWIANDGKTAEPEYTTDMGDDILPCFYSMPVVKGTFYKVDKNYGSIDMSKFVGQMAGAPFFSSDLDGA